MTQAEYEDYKAHYLNVIDELRGENGDDGDGNGDDGGIIEPVNLDYEPMAYASVRIDYEYILSLIQDIVFSMDEENDDSDFRSKVDEIRGYIAEFSQTNEKLGGMLAQILDAVEKDKKAFAGCNVSEILADMKREAIEKCVDQFADKWFVDRPAVMYAVENNNNGAIPNASIIKDSLRYADYKEQSEAPLSKLKARSQMITELEKMVAEEIAPYQIGVRY